MSFLTEYKRVLKLAIPMIVTLLAQMGMEVVDTLMMGRLGRDALAAGALGSAAFTTIIVFCVGLMSSVGVLVARSLGNRKAAPINSSLYHGLYLTLLLMVPVMACVYFIPNFYTLIHQPTHIVYLVQLYTRPLVAAMPALLFFLILREFVCAFSKPKTVTYVSLLAIPVNALGNYLLMYGVGPIPPLGIQGIGIASALVEWLMFGLLFVYVFLQPKLKVFVLGYLFPRLQLDELAEMLQVGAPVGIMMVLEVGLFSVSSALMGYFGIDALAAHQIALQCSAVVFMIPLGIAQATTIRVSLALGAKQYLGARRAVMVSLSLGLCFAIVSASVFIFFPGSLVALFLNQKHPLHSEVIVLANHFLCIAGIFQLVDVVQVVCNGALRGYKDTFMPMLLGMLSYWLIGLGSGSLLAFYYQWKGLGLWWGLAIGIGCSGIVLYGRLHYRMRHH